MPLDCAPHPIVLYDGVCALCNGFVRFVLARDRAGVFRFASLQSDLARTTLVRHGRTPDELSTLVVVLDHQRPTERLLDRSTAALFVLKHLPGAWRPFARVMTVIPSPVRNVVYNAVARIRYRTFGKYDACPLPAPEHHTRFLD